jgi:arsenate reductase
VETEASDRRLSPRVKVAECIRIRPNDPKHPGIVCTTANRSRTGLYFMIAKGTFFPGMPVLVARDFRPEDPAPREEKAVVVRVESLGSGHKGVAIFKKEAAPRRVLFVCLGNACRSPMAEALARHFAKDAMVASSAGLAPLGYVSPDTAAVLAEIGVSSAGQRSSALADRDMANVDVLINMTGRPLGKTLPASIHAESWNVADPFGCDISVYRRTRDEIKRRVLELAQRLRGPAAKSL